MKLSWSLDQLLFSCRFFYSASILSTLLTYSLSSVNLFVSLIFSWFLYPVIFLVSSWVLYLLVFFPPLYPSYLYLLRFFNSLSLTCLLSSFVFSASRILISCILIFSAFCVLILLLTSQLIVFSFRLVFLSSQLLVFLYLLVLLSSRMYLSFDFFVSLYLLLRLLTSSCILFALQFPICKFAQFPIVFM